MSTVLWTNGVELEGHRSTRMDAYLVAGAFRQHDGRIVADAVYAVVRAESASWALREAQAMEDLQLRTRSWTADRFLVVASLQDYGADAAQQVVDRGCATRAPQLLNLDGDPVEVFIPG